MNNHVISKLDDLITTLIDSVKGYEHSAGKAKSPAFETLFRALAAERPRAPSIAASRISMSRWAAATRPSSRRSTAARII